jgi:MtN3 and saliva related transmembrane protein
VIQALGIMAAALTSLSYIPQVRKAWTRGSTDDLSFRALGILAAGLTLWIVYGVGRRDAVVIIANAVGLTLILFLMGLKWRDIRARDRGLAL